LPDHPEVFVIGDAAYYRDPSTGNPLPPNAPVAIQEGQCAAENVWRRRQGLAPRPFHYQYKGELVSLGRNTAIANVFGLKLTGFPAWLLWRSYYLSQLLGFKNQLDVALDWSFAYFWRRDTARLPTDPRREAGVVTDATARPAHR
jgi:NADH dehydrogenase